MPQLSPLSRSARFSPGGSAKPKQVWLCSRSLRQFTSHFSPSPAALPYNSALSLWLSVDPMSDKYPNLSPYTYCANNPVRLKDPDGRSFYEVDGERKKIDDGHNNITIYEVGGHKFNHLDKLYNNQNLTKYNRVKTRLANRNGYSEARSNENGVSITYHQVQSVMKNATTLLNTADIAIKGSSCNDMWEGHGDGFDRRFSKAAEPYATSSLLLFPPVSTINNVTTLCTGQDIYGNQADGLDYGLATFSLLSVHFANKNSIGNIIRTTNFFRHYVGECSFIQ